MYSATDVVFQIPDESVLEKASGGFARRVFVAVLQEPAYPGGIDFLSKILTAARLNLEKDTLFAAIGATENLALLPAITQKQAQTILVFGLPLPQLGIRADIPLYQPQSFYGATFLCADQLSVLEPDKNRKGKLWQALQQLFLS